MNDHWQIWLVGHSLLTHGIYKTMIFKILKIKQQKTVIPETWETKLAKWFTSLMPFLDHSVVEESSGWDTVSTSVSSISLELIQWILFNGWVIYHGVYVPQLPYPLICWWASRLLPCPGYYKQCCNEHWHTRFSFRSGFLSVYAQKWDCWVIWQFYFQFF